jgi:opacity protein-like surface antigen
MKKFWIGVVVIAPLFFAGRARAQNPLFAGQGPMIEAGLGYSYTDVGIPSNGRVNMNGVDASVNADFSRRFGVKLDLGYVRGFDVLNTGRHADMLSYMAGPVFYPIRKKKFSVYTEFLLGGARETGVNFTSSGLLVRGFANQFAWAGGGGVQYRLTPSFSVRGGVDYMNTAFFGPNVAVQRQNNLRSVISLVYTFGEGREH